MSNLRKQNKRAPNPPKISKWKTRKISHPTTKLPTPEWSEALGWKEQEIFKDLSEDQCGRDTDMVAHALSEGPLAANASKERLI